ncbi:MAG: acetyltransferase [Bacteroidales bacterium]|nr:acetyltransferase [Bacteroidales bacterium]
MQDLYLFPFNGNALEAVNCIDKGKYKLMGFVDDTPEKQGQIAWGFQVFSREVLTENNHAKVLAVPGSPSSYIHRTEIITKLGISEERFVTIIHPLASVSPFAKIGYNVLIMAGVVITSNAVIGNHVCILPNTVVHHDSIIEDYSLIGSNVTIAGNSIIKSNCYVGSGTSIINGVTVGAFSLIGLGSNVITSIPENSKVVGNPGRVIGKII